MDSKAAVFGEWLRSEMDRRGMTQADLHVATGAGRGLVNHWYHGEKRPGPDYCRRIAFALEIDPDVVLAKAGHRPLTVPLATYETNRVVRELAETVRRLEEVIEPEPNGRPIPVYGRVPADSFRATLDEGLEPVRVVEEDLNGARNPFGLVVTGECMVGIGIYPDDVVICDRDPLRKPKDRDLVAISTADGFTFKRWCVVDRNTVELRDSNEVVAATLHPLMDEYTIEGYYVTFKPRAKR